MKNLLIAATAVSGTLVPAWADGTGASHGLYVSGHVGWSNAADHEFSFVNNTTGAQFAYTVDLEEGFTATGAVGWIYNEWLRTDVEATYSTHDYDDDYLSATFTGQNESGSADIVTLLINGWVSTDIGTAKLYVGGGVGAGWVSADLTTSNGAGRQFDGDDIGFAAQGGGGIRMPITPSMDADVSYRYRRVFDVEIDSAITGFSTTNSDFSTHSFQLGLVFHL